MRRRGTPEQPEVDAPELEDVARTLEATASEAPPSPRAPEIRMALLAELDAGGAPSVPLLRPLAILAVALLVVALAVAGPAVGSYIDRLVNEATPPTAEPRPAEQAADGSKALDGLPHSLVPVEAEVPVSSPQATPTPSVEASPAATPSPPVLEDPPPSGPPGPPIALPTPPLPISIPTPPIPAP